MKVELAADADAEEALRYLFRLGGIERRDDGLYNLWTGPTWRDRTDRGRELLGCTEAVMMAVRRVRWGT